MSLSDALTVKPFRFGVGMTATASRKEWIEKCRRAEDLGYDVIGVADHLGMPAPFPSLMLTAEVTQRVRIATAVLNTCFYNAALLARDVAATDQLTDGRLELGLGAGYIESEFDDAGIPFPPARNRVAYLEQTITELRRRFTDTGHYPQTVQRPGPPLWLGGRGNRMLTLAAREANIIGFSGFEAGKDGVTGYLSDIEGISERVNYTRDLLGERLSEVELNILVYRVSVTKNRRSEAARLGPVRGLSSDEMLDVPTVLIGTPKQISDQLLEYRARFGFTYITVAEFNLDALAPVIAELR